MVRVSDARLPGPATGPSAAGNPSAHSGVSGLASSGPANFDGTEGMLNRTGSVEVPVRIYEPGVEDLRGEAEPWGTFVWAHGGSFVRGTLDWPEADWPSRRFAEAGLRVYSVDYVLVSDTVKAPAPSNDLAVVLGHVRARHSGPVFVGGASAGAHLAVLAALQHAAKATLNEQNLRGAASEAAGSASINGVALVYPTLHRTQRPAPEIAALTAKLDEQRRFGAERIAEMYNFYLGVDSASTNAVSTNSVSTETALPGELVAPFAAVVAGELPSDHLAGLPPTVIVNAEADDLRASGEQFAEQLRSASVEVHESVQPGTVHGYLNRPEESPEATRDAQATVDRLVGGLVLGLMSQPELLSPRVLLRFADQLTKQHTEGALDGERWSPALTQRVASSQQKVPHASPQTASRTPQRPDQQTVSSLPATAPPLPTPRRAYPVGQATIFWKSFCWTLLATTVVIGLSLTAYLNGVRTPDFPGSKILTALLIVALGLLAIAVAMRCSALIRAAKERRASPGSLVIVQAYQGQTSYDELLALGGIAPRNGQFGQFTVGVSGRGVTVRANLGTEVLHIERDRVLEVAIEQRMLVQGAPRGSATARDALVLVVQSEGSARALSFLPANPKTLGVRALRGRELQDLVAQVKSALAQGEAE